MLEFKNYCTKVGLNVETMLTPKVSSTYGATRASSAIHRTGTDYVVLHTTGGTASARNEALNLHNNEGGGQSFNAVADAGGVYETVAFANVAHHAGDKSVNCRSLGFELVDNEQDKGYPNFIKYVAYAMAQAGIKPSATTVKWHNEIVPTGCGAYLRNKGKDAVIADLLHYYNVARGEGGSVAPTPQPIDGMKFKVGDLLEFSKAYENHHMQGEVALPQTNHLGRGYGYVVHVYPKDNNPYAVAKTKGGQAVVGVREVNVYRINQDDILKGATAPTTPAPAPSGDIKVGQAVTIANHAKTYATGQAIPSGYLGHKDTALEVASDKVLLKGIMSWVWKKDLVGGATTTPPKPAAPAPAPTIGVGSTVRINGGATHYATGQAIPSGYLGHVDTVLEITSDKVLLKGIMSWVWKKDVSKV